MVEEVNIFVDYLLEFVKCRGFQGTEGFFFEMTEEVFHTGIIPTVSPARHGGGDVILLGKDSIRV